MKNAKFAVIMAPGYFRDVTKVLSSHRTFDAAKRAAKRTAHVEYVILRMEGAKKGRMVYGDNVDTLFPIAGFGL